MPWKEINLMNQRLEFVLLCSGKTRKILDDSQGLLIRGIGLVI